MVRSLFDEIIAEGSEVTLTEAWGLTLLGICATNKDAKLAAEVFEKTALSYGETPDHALYAALIKVYVNCDLYEKATAVYEEEMVTKQVKPDPALSDLLMKAAVNAGRGSLAQGEYEQMVKDAAAKRAADTKSIEEKEAAKAGLEAELVTLGDSKKAEIE